MEIAGKDAELPEIRQRTRYFVVFVGLMFGAVAVPSLVCVIDVDFWGVVNDTRSGSEMAKITGL